MNEGLLLGAEEWVGETLGDIEIEGEDEGLAVGPHPLPLPDRLHDFRAYSSLSPKKLSNTLSYWNMSSFHAKSFRWTERFLSLRALLPFRFPVPFLAETILTMTRKIKNVAFLLLMLVIILLREQSNNNNEKIMLWSKELHSAYYC